MTFKEDSRIKIARRTLALAWFYFTIFLIFIMGSSFLFGIEPYIWGLPAWVAIGNVLVPIVFVIALIFVIEKFVTDISLTDQEHTSEEGKE